MPANSIFVVCGTRAEVVPNRTVESGFSLAGAREPALATCRPPLSAGPAPTFSFLCTGSVPLGWGRTARALMLADPPSPKPLALGFGDSAVGHRHLHPGEAPLLRLWETERAEPSLSRLLFSLGAFERLAGHPAKSPPRGQLVLRRGSGRTFAVDLGGARLLAHCARPVPCDDVAVCVCMIQGLPR